MADIASLIREARLPEKKIAVCLRMDLAPRYEALTKKRDLAKATAVNSDSLAASGDTSELDAEIAALEAEIKDGSVDFTLRALPRPKFRALIDKHQPRKDEEGNVIRQDLMGVNTSTFWDALIRLAVVDPALDEETWKILLEEKFTDMQFDELASSCWSICQDKVDIPFLFAG